MATERMKFVISLSSSKGGVGKTTLTNVLANALGAKGYQVTIIDADPNLPQIAWQKLSARLETMPKNITVQRGDGDETIIKTIRKWQEVSDVTIIDLEGRGSMVASDAMSRSDLVIIPAQPSMLDSREAAKALQLIHEAEERFERKIPHVVTFSKTDVMRMPDGYWELREQFENQDTPILNVELHDRDQYREIFLYGGSLQTLLEASLAEGEEAEGRVALLIEEEKKLKGQGAVGAAEKQRLKDIGHNKQVLRSVISRAKRKTEGYQKAISNANQLVAAVVNYLNGDISSTVYTKGLRPRKKELV